MIGGVFIPRSFIIVLAAAILILIVFWLFVQRSRWGIWMRATAQDPELALVSGIATRRINTLAFGSGAAMAAVAGLLVGPTWQVNYATGVPIALKAFTAAVIGGLGDLRGAIVGGLILGAAEAFFAGYISSAWKDLAVFMLLVFVIIIRPRGIFAAAAERLG